MNIEELREYCLAKPGSSEGLPFGEDTLVFKLGGKIFLIASLRTSNRFNVKCDPELAFELREQYQEVQPGFHMNKKLWNTVYMDGTLSQRQLYQMIDHSYQQVFKGLPKKIQQVIAGS